MNRLILLIALFLTGCTSYYFPMSAVNLRSALDQCKELELNVLLYERPDGSVLDVRCIPSDEEANNRIMIRPKIPINALPFYKDRTVIK